MEIVTIVSTVEGLASIRVRTRVRGKGLATVTRPPSARLPALAGFDCSMPLANALDSHGAASQLEPQGCAISRLLHSVRGGEARRVREPTIFRQRSDP